MVEHREARRVGTLFVPTGCQCRLWIMIFENVWLLGNMVGNAALLPTIKLKKQVIWMFFLRETLVKGNQKSLNYTQNIMV